MDKLSRIALDFRKGFLQRRKAKGFCWAISFPLSGYLRMLGHECDVIEGDVNGEHHVWIQMSDGRILDATADQFRGPAGERMPKAYHGPLPSNYCATEKKV